MNSNIATFFAGLLFGLGLIISGMFNPAKVLNFMDITGAWDPSLALVMIGAIGVTLPGYRWLRGWSKPLFAAEFGWPTRNDIDKPLLGGAVLFGAGWGLGGYCPGAALAGLPLLALPTVVFTLAMLAGHMLAKFWGIRGLRRQGRQIDERVVRGSA